MKRTFAVSNFYLCPLGYRIARRARNLINTLVNDLNHSEIVTNEKTVTGAGSRHDGTTAHRRPTPGLHANLTWLCLSAGRGGDTRTECLWINPACMAALQQRGLPLEGAA